MAPKKKKNLGVGVTSGRKRKNGPAKICSEDTDSTNDAPSRSSPAPRSPTPPTPPPPASTSASTSTSKPRVVGTLTEVGGQQKKAKVAAPSTAVRDNRTSDSDGPSELLSTQASTTTRRVLDSDAMEENDNVQVNCNSPYEIVATLDVSGLSNPAALYVGNDANAEDCRAHVEGDVATFSVPLDGCDVDIQDQMNGTIVHKYQISSTGEPDIVFTAAEGQFQCIFASNDLIHTLFAGQLVSNTYVGSGSGHYQFTMELLSADDLTPFPDEFQTLQTNSQVAVGVYFEGPVALTLIVDSCWVSPEDVPSVKHFLIEDGCYPGEVGPNGEVTVWPLSDLDNLHEYYFGFRVFLFREHLTSFLELSCEVHVCDPVSDPDCFNLNSDCSMKRDVRRSVRMTFSTGRLSFNTKE